MAENNQIDLEGILKKLSAGDATKADLQKLVEAFAHVQSSRQSLAESLTDTKAISGFFKEQVDLIRDNENILKDIMDVEEEILGIHQDAQNLIKDKIDKMILSGEYTEEELKDHQKLYKAYSERARKKQNHLLSIQKGAAFTDQMLKATLGLSREWEGIGAKGFMKGFAKALKSTLTLTNVLSSVASGIITNTLAFDSSAAELFKETGLTRKDINLRDISGPLEAIGTQMPMKVKESIASMHTAVTNFDKLTGSQVRALGSHMAILGEAGVSQAAMADIIKYHTHTIQESPEQANKTLGGMKQLADELGRAPNEIVTQYAQSLPTLAMFEGQSEKIFRGMSHEAKRLNMEVSELLGLTLGMDSFEGAAKAAQNFNVAFGGPFVSAQALMAASVEDKYKLIKDAFDKASAGGLKLSQRQIRGMAQDAGLDPQKLLQILHSTKQVSTGTLNAAKFEEKTAAENAAKTQGEIKDNLDIQTTINSHLEKIFRDLGGRLGADSALKTMLDALDTGLTFVADHLGKIVAGLVLLKAFSIGAALKGVAFPVIVRDVMGGAGGAVAGGLRGAAGKVAAVAAVAGLGYMALSSKDSGQAEMIEGNLKKQQALSESQAALMDQQSKVSNASQDLGKSAASLGAISNMGTPAAQDPAAGIPDAGSIAPGGLSIPSSGARPTSRRPQRPMQQTKSNDSVEAGPSSVNIKGGSMSVRSNNVTSNSEANYIQPTFNKNDKFYNLIAAKPGGDIMSALMELNAAVQTLLQKQKNSNPELDITGKELYRAVKEQFTAYGI